MKQSLLYATASALLITAAPAPAQTAGNEARTHVSLVATADLDLTTQEGQRRLSQRVARAAREVCGDASDSDLTGKNKLRKCREEAIARGLEQSEAIMAAAEQQPEAVAVTASR